MKTLFCDMNLNFISVETVIDMKSKDFLEGSLIHRQLMKDLITPLLELLPYVR